MDTKKIDIKRLLGRGNCSLNGLLPKSLPPLQVRVAAPIEKIFRRPVDHIFCIDRMVDTFLSKIVCNDVDAPFQIHRADIRRGFQKSTGYEAAIY